MHFVIEGVNPVPWAASGFSGRGRGRAVKSGELAAYQSALMEEMQDQTAPLDPSQFPEGPYDLRMWFWRTLDENIHLSRKTRDHVADTTNLFKATEDCLQGILYPNDREVRRTIGEIVEQGPDVEPKIIIELYHYIPEQIKTWRLA